MLLASARRAVGGQCRVLFTIQPEAGTGSSSLANLVGLCDLAGPAHPRAPFWFAAGLHRGRRPQLLVCRFVLAVALFTLDLGAC